MKIRILPSALFGALALSFCLAQQASAQARELSERGELLDRPAAIVNDSVVLVSELEAETDRITQQLRTQNTQLPSATVLRRQVLERLVLQKLQLQRAEKMGMRVSDDMLNTALSDLAQRNGVKFADLPATLEARGQNYADYRDEVRRQITVELLQQREVVNSIAVTPRELEQFLARQQRSPDQNAEYNLSHILISVPVSATPEQVTERGQRAQEVYTKAKAGENFAELAVAYSDSTTNIQGGTLGWKKGSQLPSIAAERIPGLKAGELTELIRTPSGFHLFRLNELRGGSSEPELVAQTHARHILLKTNELEDDGTVKQRLEKIHERIRNGEDFAAIAAVTSQDPGSAVQGGDLGWTNPGTFVPEFEQQLSQLGDNEISAPFKSQFGWHIVQLLGRRTHDATDETRRNRAFAALRESKYQEELEQWLRRLRDEAYVEYLI